MIVEVTISPSARACANHGIDAHTRNRDLTDIVKIAPDCGSEAKCYVPVTTAEFCFPTVTFAAI